MLVAVYGTLRKGFGNNALLRTSKFLGTERTSADWTMHVFTGGIVPVIVPGESSITVEVYEITDNTLENLDFLEGYPHGYSRKLIKTSYGDAWIYFMNSLYSNTLRVVESGDFSEFKQRKSWDISIGDDDSSFDDL
jgi:gamma-glutamylaminecyclotransferase